MTTGAILHAAGRIAFGYLAAAVTAVLVAETLLFAPLVASGGIAGEDLLGALAVGFVWTLTFALPGFLAVVAVSAVLGWRGCISFALAGALNAVPALFLLGVFVGDAPARLMTDLLAQSMGGGLAGGLAYWRLVGRRPPWIVSTATPEP